MRDRCRVGVLISGSGTNLQALLDAATDRDYPAEISVVVSNRSGVDGLERARGAGVPTEVLPHHAFPDRGRYDGALVEILERHMVEWVCLAGFMRILTPTVLDAFPWRVLNIHPTLLPAFPGLHGQRQALEAGVRITGATVHLVDPGTDTGPILVQGAVPVLDDDDEASLRTRILAIEHRLYPMALRWAAEGRVRMTGEGLEVDVPPGERRYLFGETEPTAPAGSLPPHH